MTGIRHARAEDAPALARFARHVFEQSFGDTSPPDDMAAYLSAAFTPEQQAAEIDDGDTITLLACEDETIVGYAQLMTASALPCPVGPRPIELRRLYVDPDRHGRGVAMRLMDALVDASVARGARTLWLGVWENNPRAIAFYGKHGFREVGEKMFVIGQDRQRDLVLARDLPDAGV